MSRKVIISIDAMGGANAPLSNVHGAALAIERHPDIFIKFFGDEEILRPLVRRYELLQKNSEIIHTQDTISDEDQPVQALKYGKHSSMRKSIDSVKLTLADACVSSGNTGALMVMSKFVLGDLPGIKRPAIIGLVPTTIGYSVMLDLGANIECDELNLFQFALMGNAFAKIVLQKQTPSIAILNVGVEEIKGTATLKKAFKMLQSTNLNFRGYIEACDIMKGSVDVIVTDGFTGNVMLKTAEGTAQMILSFIRQAFTSSILAKIGALFSGRAMKLYLSKINPKKVNGAMFIGVNGIVVKSHGSSDALGVSYAISVAHDLVLKNINEEIKLELKHLHHESGAHVILEKIKKTLRMRNSDEY